jgi:hypothetical protein
MVHYEQIRLLAGLNPVIYVNDGVEVSPSTYIFIKLQNNNYIPIGKLNKIGQPGTINIRHETTKELMGTFDSLANNLYAMSRLSSVRPVRAKEPDEASPTQPGGRRRTNKRRYNRRRNRRTNRK